jgi:hypothetical protein
MMRFHAFVRAVSTRAAKRVRFFARPCPKISATKFATPVRGHVASGLVRRITRARRCARKKSLGRKGRLSLRAEPPTVDTTAGRFLISGNGSPRRRPRTAFARRDKRRRKNLDLREVSERRGPEAALDLLPCELRVRISAGGRLRSVSALPNHFSKGESWTLTN